MRYWRYAFLSLLFIDLVSSLKAEMKGCYHNDSTILLNQNQDDTLTIGGIHITGNRITRLHIILRETTFKIGDKLLRSELKQKLYETRNLIYNTGLFVDDSVFINQEDKGTVAIEITVKERWYFFPLPYFILVDRNFNQWWVQEKGSLSRVNYGVKISENNLTGRNDKLTVWLIDGYNRQVSLRYSLPYINRSLTQGINIGFTYSSQHDLNYATSDQNKQLFVELQNEYARVFKRVDLSYTYRPNIKIRHLFRIAYNNESIADSIQQLNPLYYPNQQKQISYVDFNYNFRYTNADYNAYPTKGFIGEAFLYKRGLDRATNLWQAGIHEIFASHLTRTSFFQLEAAATIKSPFANYFINQALFGYGYYTLRGMEYYVVDGKSGALGKLTLYKELFSYIYKTPFRTKTHDKIPFRVYLKAYTDAGYCYNPFVSNNYFNNKLMHTWGIGLDIVSIYDLVIRFEYSFNQLGDNGLYLHGSSGF